MDRQHFDTPLMAGLEAGAALGVGALLVAEPVIAIGIGGGDQHHPRVGHRPSGLVLDGDGGLRLQSLVGRVGYAARQGQRERGGATKAKQARQSDHQGFYVCRNVWLKGRKDSIFTR
ncbi:hypothetical protein QGN06_23505 [Achromobacter xylosoxidans]|uniref:hypothetical protein n=1 Tax=Alcaligenes xylosoxydans xylosoxydans TaxID=85698 RepID=UPI00187D0F96|nr:hypothetical protein [Achromobacter xylosoxidans]